MKKNELEEKCDQKYILVKYNDYKHADIYSAAILRRNDKNQYIRYECIR